jgi:ribosomal protein S18 acetylase RimI-like enzyme
MTIEIRLFDPSCDQIPYPLLLEADPSKRSIQEYLERGRLYLAFAQEKVVACFVLMRTRPNTNEIMNIAVRKELQSKGIAKQCIAFAERISRQEGCRTLEVGTGNSSLNQLALYQKCGFRIIGVERNYFIKNYVQEIYENGIKCVDMIRLEMVL